MFKRINRRVTAGLMAFAIVISQVCVPTQVAFADSKKHDDDTSHDNGTLQPVWCHQVGNSTNPKWKAQLSATGHGEERFALLGPVTGYTTDANNQVLAHDRSNKLDDACAEQAIVPTPVVADPTYVPTDVCGANNDTLVWTFDSTKMSLTSATWAGDTLTTTFTATSPYSFKNADGSYQATRSIDYVDNVTDCPVVPTDIEVPSVIAPWQFEVCGQTDNDSIVIPDQSTLVGYHYVSTSDNNTHTVTFTVVAEPGYAFAAGLTTRWVFTDNHTDCATPIWANLTCSAAGSVTIEYDAETYYYTISRNGDAPVELPSGTTSLTNPGTYTVSGWTYGLDQSGNLTLNKKVFEVQYALNAPACEPGRGAGDETTPPSSDGTGYADAIGIPAPATPAQLPHSGPSTNPSAQGLLLSLFAAVATYGALYFAPSRRQ